MSSLASIFFYVFLFNFSFPSASRNIDSALNLSSITTSLTGSWPDANAHPNPVDFMKNLGASARYYTIHRNNDARMFCFFFQAQNTASDRVVMWLNGGPGVTSSIGLFFENGPFKISDDLSLSLNTDGWDTEFHMLYVDQPIGTGFSYAHDESQIRHDQTEVTSDLYHFLQEFFNDRDHDQYAKKKFYIIGQSYAVRYASALAYRIREENIKAPPTPGIKIINLDGIAIGNPLIDLGIQYKAIPHYARQNGFITKEECASIERIWVPTCEKSIEDCVKGDETSCRAAYDDCDKIYLETINSMTERVNRLDVTKPDNGIFGYDFSKMKQLFNDENVKNLLQVPQKPFDLHNPVVFEALKGDWAKDTTQRQISYLLENGIKFLSYSGDNDLICNYLGTAQSALNLPWYGQNDFKDSPTVTLHFGRQKLGSGKSYGPLTYIVVEHAGEMVPMDQPLLAFTMIHKWMKGELEFNNVP